MDSMFLYYSYIRKIYIINSNVMFYFLEEMLILFYHSCYFSLEQTKSCIEVYYTLKTNTPEFFANRDVSRPELVNALNTL